MVTMGIYEMDESQQLPVWDKVFKSQSWSFKALGSKRNTPTKMELKLGI
jgi:hypothetical protein